MKIAIVGSRSLHLKKIEDYLPSSVTEIVSGGAKGIDTCARIAAERCGFGYVEFLPDYERYGKTAPHIRNRAIVDNSDEVIAFWDGSSRGTRSVIDYCRKKVKSSQYIVFTRMAESLKTKVCIKR